MYRFAVTLALAFVFGVFSASGLPSSDPTEAKIKLLIEQLSSNDSRKREDAVKELEQAGLPALDGLRKAAKSDDPEVARLAKGLLVKLEAKLENRKRLEPTWVELKLKDVTVRDAALELTKQSGVMLAFRPMPNEKLQRKISLDTGRVPFWTALEKLCEVAEIREVDTVLNGTTPADRPVLINGGVRPVIRLNPAVVKEAPDVEEKKEAKKDEPKKEEAKKDEKPPEEIKIMPRLVPVREPMPIQVQVPVPIRVQVQGKAIQLQPVQLPVPQPPVTEVPATRRIMNIEEGKAKEVPTHVEGAFRIRAMTHLPVPLSAPNNGSNEIVFMMQGRAEPRITVLNTARVKIDKATDENGQTLSASELKPEPTPVLPAIQPNGGPVPLIIRQTNPSSNVLAPSTQPFPIRLKKGEKESKTIKELVGTVTFSIRGDAEELIEIEDLTKSKDDTVKGKAEAAMKVMEVTKGEDGVYTLKVEISTPQTILPNLAQPTAEERKRFLERLKAAQPAVPNAPNAPRPVTASTEWNTHGLELFDAKGNAFEFAGLLSTQVRFQNAARVTQTVLKFVPKDKESGEPKRLIFKGSRPVEVDVPFTLKDIVLGK